MTNEKVVSDKQVEKLDAIAVQIAQGEYAAGEALIEEYAREELFLMDDEDFNDSRAAEQEAREDSRD